MKVKILNDNNDRFLIFFQFHIFYEISKVRNEWHIWEYNDEPHLVQIEPSLERAIHFVYAKIREHCPGEI